MIIILQETTENKQTNKQSNPLTSTVSYEKRSCLIRSKKKNVKPKTKQKTQKPKTKTKQKQLINIKK